MPKAPVMAHLATAESASYVNRRAEQERRGYVEGAVQEQVANFGAFALQQAQGHVQSVATHKEAANELKSMLDRIADLPQDGTLTPEQMADWDWASKRVDHLAQLLEGDARTTEWHMERLENPLESYNAMQKKYPTLMNEL